MQSKTCSVFSKVCTAFCSARPQFPCGQHRRLAEAALNVSGQLLAVCLLPHGGADPALVRRARQRGAPAGAHGVL